MFNKYITVHSDANAVTAANITARSNEKLVDRMITSKDRADISMQEYLKLREDVATYERKIRDMGMLISELGIPADIIDGIDRSTVSVATCKDIKDYRTKYRIEFEVDEAFVRQRKEMKL